MTNVPQPQADQPGVLPTGAANPRTAVRWMSAVVLGVGVAAFTADRDSRNRALLEQAVERTAVGDVAFFPAGDRPALLFDSSPLVLAEASEPRQESAMLLAGTLEGLPYRLYVPHERVDSDGATAGATWWLKTGPGQFLKATAGPVKSLRSE